MTATLERTEVKVDHAIKCWRCDRKLAEYAARPWRFTCPRCKALNQSEPTLTESA